MDYFLPITFLEKRGYLSGMSDLEKEEFVNAIYSYYFIYDPYKDIFYNPITNKRLQVKYLQNMKHDDMKSYLEKNFFLEPGNAEENFAMINIGKKKHRTFIYYMIFSKLKWLGLIVGLIVGLFYNNYLGLSIGFYLVYLDYNYFDNVNGIMAQIEGSYSAATSWVKRKNYYFFTSIVLLIITLVSIYLYSGSFVIPIIFLGLQWLWFSSFIRTCLSNMYFGTIGVLTLKEIKENREKW